MNSSNDVIQTTIANSPFSAAQIQWIKNINLPQDLFIKNATVTDDKYVSLVGNWRFYAMGQMHFVNFSHGKYFVELGVEQLKLVRFVGVSYFQEFSASKVSAICSGVACAFLSVDRITRSSLIKYLESISCSTEVSIGIEQQFYLALYALRTLDRAGFFESTDDPKEDLEELLLDLPRPPSDKWGVYQNLDNVLPVEVCQMIENGIMRWSTMLTPKLNSQTKIDTHIEMIAGKISVKKLLNCILLGLVYYTGARPVQIAKIVVNNVFVDTTSEFGNRFSILIPYAKQRKTHKDLIRIAIPDELGKLILLYIRLSGRNPDATLMPKNNHSSSFINTAIAKMLLLFSSNDTQKAANDGLYSLPNYTATLFRHNVGHSMAMAGASATEIAYVLGHTNEIIANRYIAATPDISDIREQALGKNPVFKNMVALMLTGNIISSNDWTGRRVAGSIGGCLHSHIGGCNYEEPICPFSQRRACYGCLYFMPFVDGHHKSVFDSFRIEIDELTQLAFDTNLEKHPLLPELNRRQTHVAHVISRVENFIQRGEHNA